MVQRKLFQGIAFILLIVNDVGLYAGKHPSLDDAQAVINFLKPKRGQSELISLGAAGPYWSIAIAQTRTNH